MTPENLDSPVPPAAAKQFSPYVAEHLRWYVYALRDPRDNRVFYVGKGVGSRVFQHAKAALAVTEGSEPVSTKLAQILDIMASGLDVDAVILRHGIQSEKVAYEVEAAIIDTLRLLDPELANDRFQLTNLVLGHHHATKGMVNADVVASLYDAPTAPPILAPSILFRIPALWTPQMSSGELYEATRGWWVIGPIPRVGAEYAFAVSKGVVRGIYRITSWRERREGDRDWEQDLGKKPRWGFEGAPAPGMGEWLNTSVAHLFRTGEANPVKYVNFGSHIELEGSRDTNSFTVGGPTGEVGPPDQATPLSGKLSHAPTSEGARTGVPILSLGNDPTGHGSRDEDGVAKGLPELPTVGWRRTTGSLLGMDNPAEGDRWVRHVPLLWALRPSGDQPGCWLPPDPRSPDGTTGMAFPEGLLAPMQWWTPLLHLVRFQMGLRCPGAHLAWLRSDPIAAAAHSPLTSAQFALMDKWWGADAVEDFIAWGITSADENHPTDGGVWPSDKAVPRLSERELSHYRRRTESARWRATWGGGGDPMHLTYHASAPLRPEEDSGLVPGLRPDALGSHLSPLLAALTPGWRQEDPSDTLHFLSPDYAGWYGELLARGRILPRQMLVKVVIVGFGALGTFAIGAGWRPRMVAYPPWSARHKAFLERMVWTQDQVTVTPPPPRQN